MKDLKIRVNSESESKEAQELFFELGYVWHDTKCKTQMRYVKPVYYSSFDDMELACDVSDVNYKHKEITLPQLRDLVVLKRNDAGDANVLGDNCLYDLYLTKSRELYFYHCGKNKWILSNLNGDDDYYELLKPIEKKEMKEYLDPENGYKLNLTDRPFFDWIEIPDGAETFNFYDRKDNLFFLKGTGENALFSYDLNDWEWKEWGDIDFDGVVCLWSRHTHPEELPFIDDEPSLNDQYAEIETVRKKIRENNHYFIDVSDVDEVDFYEIAKRYNVTDPAIQHILKKCLAIGNRGHKDLETDLMDILKTAKRALRINGFGEPK